MQWADYKMSRIALQSLTILVWSEFIAWIYNGILLKNPLLFTLSYFADLFLNCGYYIVWKKKFGNILHLSPHFKAVRRQRIFFFNLAT